MLIINFFINNYTPFIDLLFKFFIIISTSVDYLQPTDNLNVLSLMGGSMLENKGVSQRVMATKNSVSKALLEMLKNRNIKKISIKELCQIAGINRTTFYNHYGSQYDVLNEIANDYLESTSMEVMKSLKEGIKFDDCLSNILQYMKENIEFAKLILDQDNYDLVSHIKVSLPQFEHIVIDHLPEELDLDEKKAVSSFVQYGTVRLLKEWVFSGCVKSSEEEAKLILKIVGKTMSSFNKI